MINYCHGLGSQCTGHNGAERNLDALGRDGEDGSCCVDLLVHLGGGMGMGTAEMGGAVAYGGVYDRCSHGYHEEEAHAMMMVVVDFVLEIVLLPAV